MQKASNLSENEVLYFYNLLFLLERTTNYEGFNIQRIDPLIKKAIRLNSDFGKNDVVIKPNKKNSMNFRGKSQKTKHLLKHIRNSFAHGLLESRNNDFYFLDVPSGKEKEKDKEKVASMIGLMDKATFYKMIKSILNTNSKI
jgi:hypothetical protein